MFLFGSWVGGLDRLTAAGVRDTPPLAFVPGRTLGGGLSSRLLSPLNQTDESIKQESRGRSFRPVETAGFYKWKLLYCTMLAERLATNKALALGCRKWLAASLLLLSPLAAVLPVPAAADSYLSHPCLSHPPSGTCLVLYSLLSGCVVINTAVWGGGGGLSSPSSPPYSN